MPKRFYEVDPRGQCYKNTAVIYCGKKTLLFLGLKYSSNLLSYCRNLPSFQGKFNVINIPKVIYCHSTIIRKVMLLYNTEWWYDHGMAVNYRGKMFYEIDPRLRPSRTWSWPCRRRCWSRTPRRNAEAGSVSFSGSGQLSTLQRHFFSVAVADASEIS